jgi:hypothetical protein
MVCGFARRWLLQMRAARSASWHVIWHCLLSDLWSLAIRFLKIVFLHQWNNLNPSCNVFVQIFYSPAEPMLLSSVEYCGLEDWWKNVIAYSHLAKLFGCQDLMSIICRWSNCTKSSNFVGLLLTSTGRDQNCHMQPFSNLSILINVVLLRHIRTFRHQLCPCLMSFLQ